MEHPWAYLRELQASFDPGKLKYTEEYYNVTWMSGGRTSGAGLEGLLWRRLGADGERPGGTELRLERQFDWAGAIGRPAAYVCGKGLVVRRLLRAEGGRDPQVPCKRGILSRKTTRATILRRSSSCRSILTTRSACGPTRSSR